MPLHFGPVTSIATTAAVLSSSLSFDIWCLLCVRLTKKATDCCMYVLSTNMTSTATMYWKDRIKAGYTSV